MGEETGGQEDALVLGGCSSGEHPRGISSGGDTQRRSERAPWRRKDLKSTLGREGDEERNGG